MFASIKVSFKKFIDRCWQLCVTQPRHRLPLSLGLATYIAFCPFVGFHTVLVLLFSWLLLLNMPLLLLISCGINNPWTMIPIYSANHLVGQLIFKWCSIDCYAYNPHWLEYINSKIQALTGLQGISLWAFLVGGNILAIVVAGAVYLISWAVIKIYSAK